MANALGLRLFRQRVVGPLGKNLEERAFSGYLGAIRHMLHFAIVAGIPRES